MYLDVPRAVQSWQYYPGICCLAPSLMTRLIWFGAFHIGGKINSPFLCLWASGFNLLRGFFQETFVSLFLAFPSADIIMALLLSAKFSSISIHIQQTLPGRCLPPSPGLLFLGMEEQGNRKLWMVSLFPHCPYICIHVYKQMDKTQLMVLFSWFWSTLIRKE